MSLVNTKKISENWKRRVQQLSQESDSRVECPNCYKKCGKVYLKSTKRKTKYFIGGFCPNCKKCFARNKSVTKKPEDGPIFLKWKEYKYRYYKKNKEKQETLL